MPAFYVAKVSANEDGLPQMFEIPINTFSTLETKELNQFSTENFYQALNLIIFVIQVRLGLYAQGGAE